MNATFVVYVKALIAFAGPALAALVVGVTPYKDTGVPNQIAWVIIIAGTISAGVLGIGSFLSRTFSDHQDAQEINTGTPQVVPAKVTAVAEPPISSPASPSQP